MEYQIYECKKGLRKYRVHILLGVLGLILITALFFFVFHSESKIENFKESRPTKTIDLTDYSIVKNYGRKGKQYYTQGLIFKDANTLIESAGRYGETAIHYVNLQNMEVGLGATLNSTYFGEGCELIENNGEQEIYQLTWRERKIFVWDGEDLSLKRVLDLPVGIKEGWGISKRIELDSDGKEQTVLYLSDGTSKIFVVDPITLEIKRTIQVKKHDGEEVRKLNELEFVKGYLWANIYFTNKIAVIDVDTGDVDYMINLEGLDELAKEQAAKMDMALKADYVLNGIAYDPENDKLIITGKKWPLMWEIKVKGI